VFQGEIRKEQLSASAQALGGERLSRVKRRASAKKQEKESPAVSVKRQREKKSPSILVQSSLNKCVLKRDNADSIDVIVSTTPVGEPISYVRRKSKGRVYSSCRETRIFSPRRERKHEKDRHSSASRERREESQHPRTLRACQKNRPAICRSLESRHCGPSIRTGKLNKRGGGGNIGGVLTSSSTNWNLSLGHIVK